MLAACADGTAASMVESAVIDVRSVSWASFLVFMVPVLSIVRVS